ncbi:MAG: hypothetical protein MUC43_20750, partial [Pirellula sp.]|nr:hypothetical protein [Pirellula sp.]
MYRDNSDSSFSFSELWQLSKFIDVKGDKGKIRQFFTLQRYSHVFATTIVVVVFGVSVVGLIPANLGINLAIPILLVTPWVSGASLSAFYRLRLSIRRDLGLDAGNKAQSQEKKLIAVFSLNCLSAFLL